MDIKLIVDNREAALIAKLTPTTKFSTENLDIGDVVFKQGEEIVYIIERKTINDLKASICDGRAREQKARLLGCGIPPDRICYVIEGNLNKPFDFRVSGMPVSTLLGSIINTQLRDGIKVYKTASVDETALYVQKLFEKLVKDGKEYFKYGDGNGDIDNVKYCATLKKKKKDNMTPKNWFIAQLCLIPQVSEKMAAVILNEYEDMNTLAESLSTDDKPELLLANLEYPITNGKTRKIGKVISKRIYFYICGLEEE